MALLDPAQLIDERRHLEGAGLTLLKVGGAVGAVALIGTFFISLLFEGGARQFLFAYLVNYLFFLSISLGALLFIPLQYLTRAGWSVAVRRVAEILACNLLPLAILFLPILLGMGWLYSWTDPEIIAADPLVAHKVPYLNVAFFLARALFYFAVWCGFAYFFFRLSTQQDVSGDKNLTLRMERWSPLALLLTWVCLSFASFDWMMSLDPHWFSTIFGVYYFAGSAVGFIALLTLILVSLQRSGRLANAVTREHYHDLGKLLFGFVVFWAYIAFSQFMLYWYANMPETTGWYLIRWEGHWLVISILLIFAHFIIPFFALLSRRPKRRERILAFWAAWLLVMHWIDIYWLIMPQYAKSIGQYGVAPISVLDLGCFIGFAGVYAAGFALFARGHSLIPMKDPRIGESLTFENA